jgi:urea transport system substrate-binding protein
MEWAYVAVLVWQAMVAKEGSFGRDAILARDGLVIDAPEGRVAVDAPHGHLYRTARVGRVGPDGVVRTVWESGAPIRPSPSPTAT